MSTVETEKVTEIDTISGSIAIEGRTYIYTENNIRVDGTSIDLNPMELTQILVNYLDTAVRRGWPAREQRGLRVGLGHQREVINKAFDAAIAAEKEVSI